MLQLEGECWRSQRFRWNMNVFMFPNLVIILFNIPCEQCEVVCVYFIYITKERNNIEKEYLKS